MATLPTLPFSAVLLAGGKSSRMGRDKAGLIVEGQPLWQRQLATLRTTGPQELFISGRKDGPYVGAGVPVVIDVQPGLGPLAGLAEALRCARYPQVLVLAIDLPAMTAAFLTSLVRSSTKDGMGIVPRTADGFEPLAAVYPVSCLPLVEEALQTTDRSLQGFLRMAAVQNLIRIRELSDDERPLFHNLNQPSDC